MVPLLLSLLALQGSALGAIPRLVKGEWIAMDQSGGMQGYRGRLAVRSDGLVTYDSFLRGKAQKGVRWRLSKPELQDLRRLVAGADFDALHREPRAKVAPSAYDGLDIGVVFRTKTGVRGWTNTVWTPPAQPVPLFECLDRLETKARESQR